MANRIIIKGYLGKKPELEWRDGRNGQFASTNFSVGVSRKFGDGTDWFFCSAMGKTAETIEKWFGKGSQIYIEGRMESYHPRNDQSSTAWVLRVDSFEFCDRKNDGQGSRQNQNAAQMQPQEPVQEPQPQQMAMPEEWQRQEDDIPF